MSKVTFGAAFREDRIGMPEERIVKSIDLSGDGRANYYYSGVDRNGDGIPDALQQEYEWGRPIVYQAPRYYSDQLVVREKKVAKAEEEMSGIVKYVEKETASFGTQAWESVIKPIGIGVAAPIGGAIALVGSVCYGAFSITRGVLGTIPLAIDYVAKPVGGGISTVVDGTDDMLKWGIGYADQSAEKPEKPNKTEKDERVYVSTDRIALERPRYAEPIYLNERVVEWPQPAPIVSSPIFFEREPFVQSFRSVNAVPFESRRPASVSLSVPGSASTIDPIKGPPTIMPSQLLLSMK
jgi:hypothetical protein